MKRFSFLLLFVILAFSITTTAKPKYVNIQHWKTKNGTSVFFVENHSLPIVDIATVFHAGSAFDQQHFGLASLTNQMIGQETKTLNTTQIANQVGDLGLNYDSSADRDMAIVHMRTMSNSKYFKPALALYTELMTGATFSQNTFDRNKSQTISAIRNGLQNPSTLAGIEFYKQLYGNNPYGHPISGTINSINNITPTEITQFYKGYYTQKNALVVIVGDVNKSQAQKIAAHTVSNLPIGNLKTLPKQILQTKINGEFVVPYQGTQSTVILGQVGINRQNKNYFSLKVGNAILGNMGLTSLLMKTIRDQHGLVYGVSSAFNPWENRGPFYIALKTKNQSVRKAIKLAKETLDNYINNGPTKEQLNASKKYLDGSFPFTFSTNRSILLNVVNIAFYQLPLNYLDTYQANVNRVTRASIQKAFKELVHPNKLTIVVAGHVK